MIPRPPRPPLPQACLEDDPPQPQRAAEALASARARGLWAGSKVIWQPFGETAVYADLPFLMWLTHQSGEGVSRITAPPIDARRRSGRSSRSWLAGCRRRCWTRRPFRRAVLDTCRSSWRSRSCKFAASHRRRRCRRRCRRHRYRRLTRTPLTILLPSTSSASSFPIIDWQARMGGGVPVGDLARPAGPERNDGRPARHLLWRAAAGPSPAALPPLRCRHCAASLLSHDHLPASTLLQTLVVLLSSCPPSLSSHLLQPNEDRSNRRVTKPSPPCPRIRSSSRATSARSSPRTAALCSGRFALGWQRAAVTRQLSAACSR